MTNSNTQGKTTLTHTTISSDAIEVRSEEHIYVHHHNIDINIDHLMARYEHIIKLAKSTGIKVINKNDTAGKLAHHALTAKEQLDTYQSNFYELQSIWAFKVKRYHAQGFLDDIDTPMSDSLSSEMTQLLKPTSALGMMFDIHISLSQIESSLTHPETLYSITL